MDLLIILALIQAVFLIYLASRLWPKAIAEAEQPSAISPQQLPLKLNVESPNVPLREGTHG